MFLIGTRKSTTVIYHIFQIATGENTIFMIIVVFLNIKVNTSIAYISISVIKNFLYQFFLFYDMSSGMWLNTSIAA